MPDGSKQNGNGLPAWTLTERLAAIRAGNPGSDPEMVAEIVRAVLTTMTGDLTATEASLLHEVEALGRTIAIAKQEIAALRVDDITASHIPLATDELDAIVSHTAAATDAILEVCETLDKVADGLTGEPAEQLQSATTRIYEACGFQDITGQRITKVVAALKMIEAKIASIIATFSDHGESPAQSRAEDDPRLLNGPQLPAMAMDQSDIDKLMASFD
jgi:chemotaxis protein CheZ